MDLFSCPLPSQLENGKIHPNGFSVLNDQIQALGASAESSYEGEQFLLSLTPPPLERNMSMGCVSWQAR